jgi:hypothetical protein
VSAAPALFNKYYRAQFAVVQKRKAARGVVDVPLYSVPKEGEVFGAMTVLERAGSRGNSTLWLCRCDCGSTAKRTTKQLNRVRRSGGRSACRACAVDRYVAGRDEFQRQVGVERFRLQFDETGTLWTGNQIGSLMDGVRADLEAEFGVLNEEIPDLPLQLAAGYPYSANDTEYASRMVRRKAGAR